MKNNIWKRQCPICGKRFKTNRRANKYCSDPCRKKAHVNQARAYERQTDRRAYYAEYYRTHKLQKKIAACRRWAERYSDPSYRPKPRRCTNCQKPFQPERMSQKFCSSSCLTIWGRSYRARNELPRKVADQWHVDIATARQWIEQGSFPP